MSNISRVYDLGHHVVELSTEGMMLIVHISVDTLSLKEGVQLGSNEVYNLCIILQAWYREEQDEKREDEHAISGAARD